MTKTQKERAFLRDLYINELWTRRFTDLVDKNVDLKGVENLLYMNAGTGNHCFELREKLDDKTAIFAKCDNDDLLAIARDKAIAVKSDVDFSTITFDDDAFDAVIADATFVPSAEID
ncbi:MAG: class I SAM-dependent methyltransferase, partial [Acidobacteriota bacterium]